MATLVNPMTDTTKTTKETLRVISHLQCADKTCVVAVKAGKSFWITKRIPNQAISEKLVKVEEFPNTFSRRVTALVDLVMVVKGLHKSGEGCTEVSHVRDDKHNDQELHYSGKCDILEKDLRKYISVLIRNNIPRVQILTVFEGSALIYPNEYAIPDIDCPSQMMGWIISQEKLEKMMASPPVTTAKTTEVKKDAVVIDEATAKKAIPDYAATKKAIAEATAKKAIAEVAIKLADKAEKKATTAETKADKATKEAFEARDAANAASEVANAAFTAYTEAVDKVTV